MKKATIEKKNDRCCPKEKQHNPLKRLLVARHSRDPDGKSSLMLEATTELKAWSLIDKTGLRSKKYWKEKMVSTKHPNFLINLGGATAHDIEALGEYVRRQFIKNMRLCLIGR